MWDVPVYAHPDEHPYLDGTASYPPPDPWVGGGLMALLSPLFPCGPIDLDTRLRPLPKGASVPGMPGWQWLHTPGHAPGHISLWREADRALIAGDAFITTGQESAYEVAVQQLEMHGPPRYFTPDWEAAEGSVRELAALKPELVISGHGGAAAGAGMRQGLDRLAERFDQFAVPAGSKYVRKPETAAPTRCRTGLADKTSIDTQGCPPKARTQPRNLSETAGFCASQGSAFAGIPCSEASARNRLQAL